VSVARISELDENVEAPPAVRDAKSAESLAGRTRPEVRQTLKVRCRTPEEMRLANALCRFVELADAHE